MNRTLQLIEIGMLSGFIGLFTEYFNAIKIVYIILLITITLDTLTGVAVAIKHKRFNCKGLQKFLKKILTYSLALLAVRLLEIALNQVFETTLLSQIMGVFLIISETVSNLRNLTMLGVPLPANFISFLLGNIKIPGIESFKTKVKTTADYLEEIDDMLKFELSSMENGCLKKLLEIKFAVWQTLIYQIEGLVRDKSSSADMIYYRMQNLIENTIEEMKDRWIEAGIPNKCIEDFDEIHNDKIKRLMTRIQVISYSTLTFAEKEDTIVESIVVLLYQTILDVRRGAYKPDEKQDSMPK